MTKQEKAEKLLDATLTANSARIHKEERRINADTPKYLRLVFESKHRPLTTKENAFIKDHLDRALDNSLDAKRSCETTQRMLNKLMEPYEVKVKAAKAGK